MSENFYFEISLGIFSRESTSHIHTREPLYSNRAVIAWWLQSTSAKIVYLGVNKGNILVNFLLLKIFIVNYYHLYIQLCICLTKFCGLSDSRYSARVMSKCDFFLKKRMEEIFAYVL